MAQNGKTFWQRANFPIHQHPTPTTIPITVSSRRSGGIVHPGLAGPIPATTMMTAVVIPVVTTSSRRPSSITTKVPIPMITAMLTGLMTARHLPPLRSATSWRSSAETGWSCQRHSLAYRRRTASSARSFRRDPQERNQGKLRIFSSVKDACFILLNCPQRTQGGLLCLGQAQDPGDIEPLVGAVGAQRAQQLSALNVPYLDGIVIPTTGQEMPVGAYPERL